MYIERTSELHPRHHMCEHDKIHCRIAHQKTENKKHPYNTKHRGTFPDALKNIKIYHKTSWNILILHTNHGKF